MRADLPITVTPERVSRFWAKVDKRSPSDCWEWTGETQVFGYGVLSEWADNRRTTRFLAHRLSLVIAGQSVAGKVVRHDCDNPPCVNPGHLRVGTQADNTRDTLERGRLDLTGLTALCDKECRKCGVSFRAESRRRYCDEHRYNPGPCRKVIEVDGLCRDHLGEVAS